MTEFLFLAQAYVGEKSMGHSEKDIAPRRGEVAILWLRTSPYSTTYVEYPGGE